jgi:UrcA family protein
MIGRQLMQYLCINKFPQLTEFGMKHLILSAIIVFSAIGSQVHAGGRDQANTKSESERKNQPDETFSFIYSRKDLDSPARMKALKQRLSSEIHVHCQVMAHFSNGPALSEQQFYEACTRVVKNKAFSKIEDQEDQSVTFSKFAKKR